ncbi:unnamed protein product [Bursaphelenchus xylophilus]|uniref:(pine wood nematode) hypothetical protein n=1 Tax=Bursaphelenchus xylophilus TaxID=6326 RepID=A0A1I7RJV3_BURXY|nr:unnamed protein product [Bursaphelenchus xylophilus]CAG9129088.1 unnamed protein product [Bursaphelenchus xylophilus]
MKSDFSLFCIVPLVTVAAVVQSIGTHYNVTFKGRLLCDGGGLRTLRPVKVLLWEEDGGQNATINPDDLLAETVAQRNGTYSVSGQTEEVGNIEPYIEIHHNCGGDCLIMRSYQNVTDGLELFGKGEKCYDAPEKPKKNNKKKA